MFIFKLISEIFSAPSHGSSRRERHAHPTLAAATLLLVGSQGVRLMHTRRNEDKKGEGRMMTVMVMMMLKKRM